MLISMVRTPKVVSIERLVGGRSVEGGQYSGPGAEAVLAEIDRQVEKIRAAKPKDVK